MNSRSIALLVVVASAALAFPASAGDFPDTDMSTAVSAGGTALISPAGTGQTLANVGAQVTVTVLDLAGMPWPNYPAQDVWLGQSPYTESNLAICSGGSIADGPSNANGVMTISGPVAGGGHCSYVTVYILNTPLSQPSMPIRLNSPDIDGDLDVDLVDFAEFGADYGGDAFRSDLVPDGVVNLADFAEFGARYGEACP